MTTAAPWGELSPFPASLETCPCHGASGSLRSPLPNPAALQEPSGGHSPFAGRQHTPEKGSQQSPKTSGGSGEGRHPHRSRGGCSLPVPQGRPSACPRACSSGQRPPAAQDLSLQYLLAISTSSGYLKRSEISSGDFKYRSNFVYALAFIAARKGEGREKPFFF